MYEGELPGNDSAFRPSQRGCISSETLAVLEHEEDELLLAQQQQSQSVLPECIREGTQLEAEDEGFTSRRESKNNAIRKIAFYLNEENKEEASVYAPPPVAV